MRKLISLYGVLFFVLLYAPVVLLIVYSFRTDLYQPSDGVWTFHWYNDVFYNATLMSALINSLLVASISAVIAVLFGLLLAYWFHRNDFRLNKPLNSLVNLVLIAPDISIAIGLMLIFQAIGLTLGLGAIIVAHITFGIAYATVMISARFKSLNANLEYAARDLGATEIQSLYLVVIPVIKPAIIAALLICFTLSWDDFIYAFYNSSPGQTTLPVQMFALIKRGATPGINAIGTMSMLLSFTLIFVSLKFQKIINLF